MKDGSNLQGKILYSWDGDGIMDELRFTDSAQLSNKPYDIVIIGAGVVGSALAYKLSLYKLRILLVDKNYDVGEGTSKGSSAIIHTGFDAPLDTLESQLVTKASKIWPLLAEKLKIPFKQCSAVLVAIDDEQHNQLDKIHQKSMDNGVNDVKLLSTGQVKELVPDVNPEVRGGMLIPRESIIDPFSIPIAFSEVALANGVDILLGSEIVDVENPDGEIKNLVTAQGQKLQTKMIVNVAGLGTSKLTEKYGGQFFNVNPRRGQFIIFDKISKNSVDRILLPIPTAQTKGVLVIPTIFGNLLAGPTAEDFLLDDQTACDTTIEGLQAMIQGASRLYPPLKDLPQIGSFSGIRCACKQGTYQIRYNDGSKNILTVSGIRSTGVTSSPALAEYLIDGLVKNCGLKLIKNPTAVNSRSENSYPGWWKKPFLDDNLIKKRPDYGRIICNCEDISQGEIVDALNSPLRPFTLDAIKRRTMARTGRCQGFDCTVKIIELISEHQNIPINKITKNGPGSEIANG